MKTFCLHILPVLSLILVNSCILDAQYSEIRWRDAGNPEDYSFIQTTCLFQDSRGFIWIGTEGGLNRWDGIRIMTFPRRISDSHGIQAFRIHSIVEDKENNLWLTGSAGALIRYNLVLEEFSRINLDGLAWDKGYLHCDPAGFLWLGCSQGLFHYYPLQDSLVQIPMETAGMEGDYVFESMEIDTTGVMWIAEARRGLYYVDEGSTAIRMPLALDPGPSGDPIHLTGMSLGSDGDLWILNSRSELYKYNPYTGQNRMVWAGDDLGPGKHGAIAVDHQGNIWFGTADGLKHYDPISGKITIQGPSYRPLDIRDILVDSHDNILVASSEAVKIVDRPASFIRIHDAFSQYLPGFDSHLMELVWDGEYYWAGTNNCGVLKYCPEKDEISHYRAGEEKGDLSSDEIRRILKDRKGKIWIMTGQGDLLSYDSRNDIFNRFSFHRSTQITQGDKGFFWLFSPERIMRFDPISFDSIVFRFRYPLNCLEAMGNGRSLIKVGEGSFWLAACDSLFRINHLNGTWRSYSKPGGVEAILPKADITCLFCDSRQRIWMGTEVGLSRIVTFPGSDSVLFRNYLFSQGIPFRTNRIAEDQSGNIWIGTNSGIYVIRENGAFENYCFRERLPGMPMNVSCLDGDGEGGMYVGERDLLHIPADFLYGNPDIPKVLLTGLSISGEPVNPGPGSVLERSFMDTKKLDLRHDQNFLRFDFAVLSFTDPDRNQYRYLLEGLDKDTMQTMGTSFAEYRGLPPGNYRFWVTGSNNAGLWNPSGTSVHIRIRRPWHSSAPLILAYFVLLSMLAHGFLRKRTARLRTAKAMLEIEVEKRTAEVKKKNEQIVEMENLKTRFFTNISHEFRTLITLIYSPVEEVLQDRKTAVKTRSSLMVVKRNANRLMKLVNQLLDLSKIDTNRMKLVMVQANVYDFVHTIAVSYSSLAELRGIRYRFHLPDIGSEDWFDAEKLETIINNLLSNAFKYTKQGGKVMLDMYQIPDSRGDNKKLEIKVSDTGQGIPEKEKVKIFDRFYQAEAHLENQGSGTGLGLALVHDLVELMHGEIVVESKAGAGSTFYVRIPLGLDHLESAEFVLGKTGIEGAKGMAVPKVSDVIHLNEEEEHGLRNRTDANPMRHSVLIVEDNTDVRTMLADYLGHEYLVIEAVNGKEGLELARNHIPDVILADLLMPVMDGIRMCSEIKSDLLTSHIPVVMLTAKSAMEEKLEGLRTGADDYIPKPFQMQEVKIRINNLILQRKILREKFSREISIEAGKVAVTPVDQSFLMKAIKLAELYLGDERFDVGKFSKEMNVSRSTLTRKLMALTDLTPIEFIRTIRLKRAASLLKQNFGNVSEVSLEVGFSSPSYFSKIFKRTYGIAPSEFVRTSRK